MTRPEIPEVDHERFCTVGRVTDETGSSRPVLLTPHAVAEQLGVTTSTLRTWRANTIGPRWTQLGPQTIRYRAEDIDAYIESTLSPVTASPA